VSSQHSADEMAEQRQWLRRTCHLIDSTNMHPRLQRFLVRAYALSYTNCALLSTYSQSMQLQLHVPPCRLISLFQSSATKVHHMHRNMYIMFESVEDPPIFLYPAWYRPDAAACDMREKYVLMKVVRAEAFCVQSSYSVLWSTRVCMRSEGIAVVNAECAFCLKTCCKAELRIRYSACVLAMDDPFGPMTT
jgi:hypothetical protein